MVTAVPDTVRTFASAPTISAPEGAVSLVTDRFYDDAFLSAVYDAWHPRSIRDDYDFYLPYVLMP